VSMGSFGRVSVPDLDTWIVVWLAPFKFRGRAW
jgi:hypothetical protein